MPGTIKHRKRMIARVELTENGKWMLTTMYLKDGGTIYDWETKTDVLDSPEDALGAISLFMRKQ